MTGEDGKPQTAYTKIEPPRVGSRWHKGSRVGAPGARSFRVVDVVEDTRANTSVVVIVEWMPRMGWIYDALSVVGFCHRVKIGLFKQGPLPRKVKP